MGSEMPHPRLQFLGLEVERVNNHSEEHLVIACSQTGPFEVGDLIYALPTHICPTMALHEEVYVVQDQRITTTWKVRARRRMYPF